MPRYATTLALMGATLLVACQSPDVGTVGQTGAERTAMMKAMTTNNPRKMSDKQRAQLLADADSAQAMAPAMAATGALGGLDPTGLAQTGVNAEGARRMAKLQAQMPAMIEDNRARVAEFCRAEPKR